MKVLLAGNDLLAILCSEYLLTQGVELFLLPEGLDASWERSFRDYNSDINFIGPMRDHIALVRNFNPDLIVGLRLRKLVPKEILDIAPVVNIHFGPLPRYGGMYPIFHQIRNGEEYIGVTMHFMSPMFDEGPIIGVATFDTRSEEHTVRLRGSTTWIVNGITAYEAYNHAIQVGYQLFIMCFPNLFAEVPVKQEGDRLYYTSNSVNFIADRIWSLTESTDELTEELSRHIRSFTFPPCQYPVLRYLDGYELEVRLQ